MSDYIADQKALFWKTTAEIEALDAKLAPMRAERDALQAQFEPKLRALNEAIQEAAAPRYDLSQKHALLAKGLGDKVGERPA